MELDISQFMSALSPASIYTKGMDTAGLVGEKITPFILLIAIGIRTLETQVDALTSGTGKWGRVIRDVGIWATILSLYYILAGLVSNIFNDLYAEFSQQGSMAKLMASFNQLQGSFDKSQVESKGALFGGAMNLISSGAAAIPKILHYLSFVILSFVATFLQCAHALAYSFAVMWGLIAIPISMTLSFKILAPWARFTGTVLVWPIVSYAAFALFIPVFVDAANALQGNDSAMFDTAQLYLLFTIINFIAIAIIVSAPMVAQALLTNGSVTGVVAPFTAAAVGAASTFIVAGSAVAQQAKNKKTTEKTDHSSKSSEPSKQSTYSDISVPREKSRGLLSAPVEKKPLAKQKSEKSVNKENEVLPMKPRNLFTK